MKSVLLKKPRSAQNIEWKLLELSQLYDEQKEFRDRFLPSWAPDWSLKVPKQQYLPFPKVSDGYYDNAEKRQVCYPVDPYILGADMNKKWICSLCAPKNW